MSYGLKSFSHRGRRRRDASDRWHLESRIVRGLGKEIRLDVWIEGWRRLEVGLIWENVLCVLRYAVKRAVVPRNNAHAQASQKERDVCAVRYTHTPVLDTTRNCNEKNSLTL